MSNLIPVLSLGSVKAKELPPNKNNKVYFELPSNTLVIDGKLCRVYNADVFETDPMTGKSTRSTVLRYIPIEGASVPKDVTAEHKASKGKGKPAGSMNTTEVTKTPGADDMALFKQFQAFMAMAKAQ